MDESNGGDHGDSSSKWRDCAAVAGHDNQVWLADPGDVKLPVKDVRFDLSGEATKNNWEGHYSPGHSPTEGNSATVTPGSSPVLPSVGLKDLRSEMTDELPLIQPVAVVEKAAGGSITRPTSNGR